MVLPRTGVPYVVFIDALGSGIGCVLMQEDKVIAYASRELWKLELSAFSTTPKDSQGCAVQSKGLAA